MSFNLRATSRSTSLEIKLKLDIGRSFFKILGSSGAFLRSGLTSARLRVIGTTEFVSDKLIISAKTGNNSKRHSFKNDLGMGSRLQLDNGGLRLRHSISTWLAGVNSERDEPLLVSVSGKILSVCHGKYPIWLMSFRIFFINEKSQKAEERTSSGTLDGKWLGFFIPIMDFVTLNRCFCSRTALKYTFRTAFVRRFKENILICTVFYKLHGQRVVVIS